VKYFLTAIGTDSGKTLASAIVAKALNADYWKPVQAGSPTDSETINRLTEGEVTVHPEGIILKKPASPHDSAKEEKINLRIEHLVAPDSSNDMIIEGAGGILVPLNDNQTMIDMVNIYSAEIILVSDLYLGSINHTLLTLEAIKKRRLSLKGIIFNGPSNTESEDIILKKAGVPLLLKINKEKEINPDIINQYAADFKKRWNELGY